MSTTAANVPDIAEAHNLLHGGETAVWCDSGYQECTSGRKTWGVRWTASEDETRKTPETGPWEC